MPLALVGLWLGLSAALLLSSTVPQGLQRYRWPVLAITAAVLAAALALAWTAGVEPLPRWRDGFVFDQVGQLLLPPMWTGAAASIVVALFIPGGRYEPAIAAISTSLATAGILSANPLLTIALLQAGALVILGGLLVHDEGMQGHPLLNVATGLKYLTLTVVSTACLVMALLLSSFYALNPDRADITRIAAAVFIVGFGLAAGAMPFYFHVPDVFEAAPALATVSLSGPLQCLAVVYLIRSAGNSPWLLTDAHVSDVLVAGGLGGALLAATMTFGQARLSRVMAFNAIRELGWIAFGLATVSRAGWRGALIFLAVRCISQPLMLMAAQLAQTRRNEVEVDKLGALARLLPLTTFGWCAGVFASVGLPPAASFWGLGALLNSSSSSGRVATAALVLSGMLALWRLGKVTYAIFWRPNAAQIDPTPEAPAPSWAIACLGLGLGFAGVVPKLLDPPLDRLLASLPFLR